MGDLVKFFRDLVDQGGPVAAFVVLVLNVFNVRTVSGEAASTLVKGGDLLLLKLRTTVVAWAARQISVAMGVVVGLIIGGWQLQQYCFSQLTAVQRERSSIDVLTWMTIIGVAVLAIAAFAQYVLSRWKPLFVFPFLSSGLLVLVTGVLGFAQIVHGAQASGIWGVLIIVVGALHVHLGFVLSGWMANLIGGILEKSVDLAENGGQAALEPAIATALPGVTLGNVREKVFPKGLNIVNQELIRKALSGVSVFLHVFTFTLELFVGTLVYFDVEPMNVVKTILVLLVLSAISAMVSTDKIGLADAAEVITKRFYHAILIGWLPAVLFRWLLWDEVLLVWDGVYQFPYLGYFASVIAVLTICLPFGYLLRWILTSKATEKSTWRYLALIPLALVVVWPGVNCLHTLQGSVHPWGLSRQQAKNTTVSQGEARWQNEDHRLVLAWEITRKNGQESGKIARECLVEIEERVTRYPDSWTSDIWERPGYHDIVSRTAALIDSKGRYVWTSPPLEASKKYTLTYLCSPQSGPHAGRWYVVIPDRFVLQEYPPNNEERDQISQR